MNMGNIHMITHQEVQADSADVMSANLSLALS